MEALPTPTPTYLPLADRDALLAELERAVIANGGTTLTGSVDPLDALADVCAEAHVWLHVDGAYGLAAAATDRARDLFAGHNAALAAAAQDDRRIFLADTMANGRRCLRVCFVDFRTRTENVTFAIDTLRELGRELADAG